MIVSESGLNGNSTFSKIETDNMYCCHCGTRISQDASFCPKCGKSVTPSQGAVNYIQPTRLFAPGDVHDPAPWDRYWLRVAKDRYSAEFNLFGNVGSLFLSSLIQCLIKRGAKTVLCAGNGISQEPRALAAAGFEVTALDFSPTALRLAEAWQFSSKELDWYCPKEHRAPGGTAGFVVGDLLDRSVCPGPFDAIIEHRTLQLFPEEERGLALDALASRLEADGLFLSHCHDGRWQPPNKPVHRVEQVFRDHGWSINGPDHGGRVVWLILSTG